MPETPYLSVVVPVYNEEDALPRFLAQIRPVLASITEDYEIIFAADPCTDRTIEMIRSEHSKDGRIKLLQLSRRFGQPASTLAGLHYSCGQAVVVIDCDLQDPPSLIPEMVRIWKEGYKVVIPQRRSRAGEHPLKRLTTWLGYKFINKISDVRIPRNAGDFRLMDRRVVEEICKLNESHGFLRGLVAVVGFKTYLLPFDREARAAGQGKYQRIIGNMRMNFNSIVCFSDYVLNALMAVGAALITLSILGTAVAIYLKLADVYQFSAGIATLILLALFLSGTQLIGMGILGLYISRIYDEAKRRPIFIVEESLGFAPNLQATRPVDVSLNPRLQSGDSTDTVQSNEPRSRGLSGVQSL
jgi:dolichol-phosphate mannosyltransferase